MVFLMIKTTSEVCEPVMNANKKFGLHWDCFHQIYPVPRLLTMVMNINKRPERKEDREKIVYKHFRDMNRARVICTKTRASTCTDVILLLFPAFKTHSLY